MVKNRFKNSDLYGRVARWKATPENKAHDGTPDVCKKKRYLKDSESMSKRFCDLRRRLNSLAWMQSATSGGNRAQITHLTPFLTWSMVLAQHHAMGMLFSTKDWNISWIEGTMNGDKSKQILEEKWRSCFRMQQNLDCGEDLSSNRTMTAIIQPKQHWNGFRTRSWKSLSGPAEAQTWNPTENLWKDLKIAVHRRSPSNLTELKQICKEEWEKIPKSKCAKLMQTYPRRLEAVFAAKDASTKYRLRGLKTWKLDISV